MVGERLTACVSSLVFHVRCIRLISSVGVLIFHDLHAVSLGIDQRVELGKDTRVESGRN